MTEEKTTVQTTPEKEATWYDGEIPIIFDAYKDYPVTDIKLSELADAEYIALETTDESILRLSGTCKGNEYLLTDDYIYLEDRQEEIFIFTREGKFVRKINRRGEGKHGDKAINELANSLSEDDNPILQVMIFHDVESVKR